jgi:molybdenum cofactor synthesis domain-containing protein
MALIAVEEAEAYVLGLGAQLPAVRVPLREACGLVTAADVVAGEAVPPFANSAMDGYAVQAADTADAPAQLEVVGFLAAGAAPDVTVGPGQAVRIMTGAAVPDGADAVVLVEETTTEGDRVTINISVEAGTAVRPPGDDIQAGTVVVATGTVLGPGHIGVLASVGVETIEVVRRPRVGVLSTGDELVEGSAPLAPGQIREANRPALLALVAQCGFEPVDLGIAADDEVSVTDAIERGVADCDLVLTSGGVSMGDLDFVKVVLDRLGEMRWMQIAIKPAKPLAAGVVQGVPVVGLPGNPVSSLVSYELFAHPLLRKLAGHARLRRPRLPGVSDDGVRRHPDGKTHFVRVVAEPDEAGVWHARSAGGQGSHQLAGMAAANALAVVPDGPGVPVGGPLDLLLLAWP